MKSRTKQDEPYGNTGDSTSIKKNQMMKKKKKRLGGGGLSLEAFANAKSKSNDYNPALIKKQKEFYKNAKCVTKYKKTLKQQNQYSDPSWDIRPQEGFLQDNNETGDASTSTDKKKKKKKMISYSLRKVYEKKHEEEENEKREREAAIQARKEAIEKSQSLRKAKRQNMFKKTRSGQPVMKYRIEQLLESIQASAKK